MATLWGTLALHVAAGLLIQELPGQAPPEGPLGAAPRAEQTTPRPNPASVRTRLAGLPLEATMRVRLAGGPRVSGRYGGVVSEGFVLRTGVAQSRVRATLIDSLWTRERPIVPTAVHGAASGALVGVMLRLGRTLRATCSSRSSGFGLPQSPDCRITTGRLTDAVARGALIGLGVGAVIGAVVPKRRLRLP